METFLVGLVLVVAGLVGVFFGYRIFRIILPILGGIEGYLIASQLFPNSWVLALVVGIVLAIIFFLLAYTVWSVMVTISGVILGGAIGAAIAHGLNLWTWLGWIIIIVLAVLGGILVWMIRDEVVIILTAISGAGFVASGLRTWFGEGTIRSIVWLVIFIVLAIIGIIWQWQRYRHLKLLGMGGAAETPGATRTGAVVEPAATPVATAGGVAAVATMESAPEKETSEEVPEPPEEPEPPEVPEPPEEPVVPEEKPLGEEEQQEALNQLEETLDGTQMAALQEKVNFVEGIGSTYAGKLNEAGIETVIDLLRRGATRKGRAELVTATAIPAGLILKWVNQADLLRVKGVGKQFGELLEAAGVDTVPELAQRNPVNLFTKLSEVNSEKNLTGRSPHQDEVESWVAQAKNLPRIIEY